MLPLSNALLIQIAVLLPIAGAIAIGVAHNRPNIREAISLLTCSCLLVTVLLIYRNFTSIDSAPISPTEFVWFELMPTLSLSFSIEPLAILFALMSSFLWLVTTIYAIGYMRHHHEKNQTRFYQFFAVSMAAVMGIAFSANLFTLYIFYELLTLTTYPLVTHARNQQAKKGGRTYLTILLFTSVLFFLPALISVWLVAGTLDFTAGGVLSKAPSNGLFIAVLLPLFILGIGKAAVFPFHRWLPAAMVAPTPVSALLHAVAVVKGGVFAILKVCVYIFGIDLLPTLSSTQVLLYLVGFTIFIASLIAMREDNLKKRLAYSTVSQLGYITLGALLANKAGIVGSGMHMAIHGFGKITLFFCAGAILIVTGRTRISEMAGIGRQMPITMVAFFIASLSIIGLPPTAGIWSKWFLMQGTIQAQEWWLLALLCLSSLMNLFYLLSIPLRGFFAQNALSTTDASIREAPLPMLFAIIICTTACVWLFVTPEALYQLAGGIFSDVPSGDLQMELAQ